MKLRLILVLLCAIGLTSCSAFFGSSWEYFGKQSEFGSDPKMNHAKAQAARDRFSETMRECVAAYDPNRLKDLEAGGEYEVSGWFVDKARVKPVWMCMEDKGWMRVGNFSL